MRGGRAFICGLAAGAALMYLLDPERGRRRRALLRDQLVSANVRARRYLDRFKRHMGNRAVGLVAVKTGEIREWAGRPRVRRRASEGEG